MTDLITCSHCNKPIPDQDRAVTFGLPAGVQRTYCRPCYMAGVTRLLRDLEDFEVLFPGGDDEGEADNV